jgi:methionyl aminopeptidase
MAIRIKTKEDIAILREGGKRHAAILKKVAEAIRPGMSTIELDTIAHDLIRAEGDVPSFLNFTPQGAKFPFPGSICISVNNEIVHGIPGSRVLQDGDIVKLDLGLTHEKLITDAAITVCVGTPSKEDEELMYHTEKALEIGIRAAKGGATVYDIGEAIERYLLGHNINIIEDLCGHGVGYSVHEDPFVPNYAWEDGKKIKLVPGMVIAIEPITTLGDEGMELSDDGFTYTTKDGSNAVQFEHTILITKGEPEILTI